MFVLLFDNLRICLDASPKSKLTKKQTHTLPDLTHNKPTPLDGSRMRSQFETYILHLCGRSMRRPKSRHHQSSDALSDDVGTAWLSPICISSVETLCIYTANHLYTYIYIYITATVLYKISSTVDNCGGTVHPRQGRKLFFDVGSSDYMSNA